MHARLNDACDEMEVALGADSVFGADSKVTEQRVLVPVVTFIADVSVS